LHHAGRKEELKMIAFSTVDGHLHKKEYDFLYLIANALEIDKVSFNDLFHQNYRKSNTI
jgi:hypothetical protein